MQITIKNWDRFNPRKDVKNPSWFRLGHDLFENPDFYEFSHAEIITWVYVLCLASKKNSDTVQINLNHAEKIGRIKRKELLEANNKLEQIHCLALGVTETSRKRNENVTDAGATNERTNVTNETNTPTSSKPAAFDFELIYQKYPRKLGKSKGLATCKSQIISAEDFEQLSKAVSRYSDHCVKQGTEPKYIKHFSTFMFSWRDWLDPEAGAERKPTSSMYRDLPTSKSTPAEPKPEDVQKQINEIFGKKEIA